MDEKVEVFGRIWQLYANDIKDVLVKSGVVDSRLPDYGKLQLILEITHLNKLRHTEEWLTGFIKTHILPWRKVRAENTQEYWDNIELLGMGKDFKEVKLLKECAKKIKADWFTPHNFLAPVKKEKKKDGEGKEQG